MSRKTILLTFGLMILSGFGILLYTKQNRPKYALSTSELGFPLVLARDEKFSEFYTWKGQALISAKDYSRENLERIFAWYSNRHPSGSGTIILHVYTKAEDLDKNTPVCVLPADPSATGPSTDPSNAMYIRDERDGSENYGYDLDPVKKDKQASVTLRIGKRQ